jgi:P27 family predicted phage terminase small subunit
MKRGPKVKTAQNSLESVSGLIRHRELKVPKAFPRAAKAEFRRLIQALTQVGLLDKVDLGVITECARVTGLLHAAHKLIADDGMYQVTSNGLKTKHPAMDAISILTSQRRGLLRELGLTISPRRAQIKNAESTSQDPLEALIKLHG